MYCIYCRVSIVNYSVSYPNNFALNFVITFLVNEKDSYALSLLAALDMFDIGAPGSERFYDSRLFYWDSEPGRIDWFTWKMHLRDVLGTLALLTL